jgi:CheY-like chemotaxis protein
LQETLDLVQPLAAARNVRLISLPCTSRYVMADRQRLKQVLINLVSNAIKYNRLEGSVTITCEASENHARIAITDTGIGIPAERIEQLFTPFQRLGAEHSAIEGTGLGLTVAKRLVEAMAGTIGVESTPGQGTTFWVEFLLTDSALAIAELPHEDAAPEVLPHERTQKVLYIEDNLSNLRLIERLLERRPGIELLAANEGVAGIGLAQQHRPELILLDVNLPDIDGHEVLRRLRADPQSASIPVVAISAMRRADRSTG